MVARIFRIRPKRLYWQVYIEAWQNSGMSQSAFCKEHGLYLRTFTRWRKMFEDYAGYKFEQIKKRRRKPAQTTCALNKGKAVKAFWAMHIEALWWSGLPITTYAKAHHLSKHTLKKWQDRLFADPEDVNWRDLVHPSARPALNPTRLSTGARTDAKEFSPEIKPPKDGHRNRRIFTLKEKRAIVMEADIPNISVAEVARRHDIATSMIFRWRSQFDFTKKETVKLISVEITDNRLKTRATDRFLKNLLPSTEGMVAVKLPGGAQVFAAEGSDPEEVRAYIASQEKSS